MGEPHSTSPIRFVPLVNLTAGRIVGFAAHSPDTSAAALRNACRAASSWPEGFALAVELPLAQWREPATALHVLAALGKGGLPADRLELAIPDAAPARDLNTTRALIDEFRRFGVRVALTGCGALAAAAMPAFEIDKIELAGHLVGRIGRDPQSERRAAALLNLAHDHGIVAAASGIDSGAQYDTLREMGCAEGYGALFGPALAAQDIPALLRIPGIAEPATNVA